MSVRLSVRMSVSLSGLGGNVIFSAPIYKIKLSFFVCTFLLYMSIYSVNILSFCLSVMLQKALLLMDVVILDCIVSTSCLMLLSDLRIWFIHFLSIYCLIVGPSRFNHNAPNLKFFSLFLFNRVLGITCSASTQRWEGDLSSMLCPNRVIAKTLKVVFTAAISDTQH